MRTAFALLIVASGVSLAAERPFDFGLMGKVTIKEANYLMDGGTIIVALRDEHGNKAGVRLEQSLFPNAHNGQFHFTGPNGKQSVWFQPHSSDETALLELLRSASVTTLGTSDPKALKKASEALSSSEQRYWDHRVMYYLFRYVAARRPPPRSR